MDPRHPHHHVTHGKISTYANFMDPHHSRHFFNPRQNFIDPSHPSQNFNPSYPCHFFDPRQNFTDPRYPNLLTFIASFSYIYKVQVQRIKTVYLLAYSYYIGQVISKFSINIDENFQNIQNKIFGRCYCFLKNLSQYN